MSAQNRVIAQRDSSSCSPEVRKLPRKTGSITLIQWSCGPRIATAHWATPSPPIFQSQNVVRSRASTTFTRCCVHKYCAYMWHILSSFPRSFHAYWSGFPLLIRDRMNRVVSPLAPLLFGDLRLVVRYQLSASRARTDRSLETYQRLSFQTLSAPWGQVQDH